MEIGAQLFTVAKHCGNIENFAESLKKVADIGYKNVQVSGTCDYEPEWLKEQLDKNGLKCVITHIKPERLTGETDSVIKAHNIFGCDYIGLGWYDSYNENQQEKYAEFIEKYKPVAKAFRENGKYFMYHNHDMEFRKIDGKLIIEKLSEDFSADEMGFTFDTYWAQKGGADPAYWIERFCGRVPCIHLKDYSYGGKMAVIGEGNINFDRVFQMAEKSGTKYMLVEQDDCNGEDPFECLRRSYNNLHTLGFE